jgi:hypothetical protein
MVDEDDLIDAHIIRLFERVSDRRAIASGPIASL